MTEHTTKSWVIGENPLQVFDEHGLLIANCMDASDLARYEDCKNHARLIVAAPDLLDAAKAATTLLKRLAELEKIRTPVPVVDTLDAAIRKATQP